MKRTLIKETATQTGKKVRVCGWVDSRRDHGKIIFIDLRDASGLLQVVFVPQNEKTYALAQELRPEWVVSIEGRISDRPEKMINEKIGTGKIEMQAESLEVYNKAKTLPFEISGKKEDVNEEIRMKYRYLDIRREKIRNNLILRHKVIKFMRNFMEKEGFIEVETPVLTKSTPEGARDYVVPSRNNPGNFYALPQSPQQYKQLLMVAGLEKYFQIAKCFRDEDPRGDRQPEFTQLDIETSFMDQDEILDLIERLYIDLVKTVVPEKHITQIPFPKLTHKEAMEKYGSDKPDLRKDKNDPNELAFAFVVDFPMFGKNKETGKWDSEHHPFTMMKEEDLKYLETGELEKIKASSYDFVLNGYEMASGSIRINRPEIQKKVFNALGLSDEEINDKFGHMIEAFEFGAPPHGGIAPGIDRFVMILANEPSIREVIAFPKTGDGRDLMMEAPSEISKDQLKELQLEVKKKK